MYLSSLFITPAAGLQVFLGITMNRTSSFANLNTRVTGKRIDCTNTNYIKQNSQTTDCEANRHLQFSLALSTIAFN